MKNLLLILALLVVSCSETEPLPFIEFSTIDDEIKCELFDDEFNGGAYFNFVFTTEHLENYQKQFVEVNYFRKFPETNEYLPPDLIPKVPYIKVENLVEFTYEDEIKTAFEDSLQITNSKLGFKIVINTDTLKAKIKTHAFENATFSGEQNTEFVAELDCKRISPSSNPEFDKVEE